MKRIFALLAVLIFSLALFSCKGGKEEAGDMIKVGVLAPTNIYFGEMVQKGAELAAEQINAKGGILGKKIKLIVKNTEYKPDVGKLELTKAIKDDKIDVIIGGVNSAVVLSAMDVMADNKKIWLGTGGASPKVVGKVKEDYERYKYYFRVGTIDALAQGAACANFVIDFLSPKFGDKVKKIALVGADHAYSKFILGQTKKALEANGNYEVAYENYLPTSTTDFSPVFAQIKEKEVKLVIQAWPSSEAITFAKQYYAQKVPAILMGATVEALKDEYGEETGGAAAYELDYSPQSGPAPMTSKTLAFAEAFKKKFGKSAGYIAYPAYDTLYVLKAAAEKVGSLDSDKLIKEMEAMEYEGNIWYNFKEDNHDLTMGIEGDKVYADFVWFQWQEDKSRKAVYPEKFKQAEFKLAPWVAEVLK